MSSAVEDFLFPAPSVTRSYFQNPNPSLQKHPTDSGIFNNTINLMNFNNLDFDCSNHAPATIRSKKKHVKVKKHSNCSDSVSTKTVNSNSIGFVFNSSDSGSVLNSNLGQMEQQSVGELLDNNNMLRFTIGATSNCKAEKIGSVEVPNDKNSGNSFQPGNLSFAFGADEKAYTRNVSETGGHKFGKLNGMDYVFGEKMNNVNDIESGGTVGRSGVDGLKVNNFATEVDSELVNSISSLNLGTGGSGDVGPLMNDNSKREGNNTSDGKKIDNSDFVFSANHGDIQTDADDKKEESKEKVGKLVPDGIGEMKLDANMIFGKFGDSGTATEDLGKKNFGVSSTELKSGDSVNMNVDSGIMFSNGNVDGVFHIGTHNEKRSSFKGSRKLDEMNILKSNEAGSYDYLKKQENNIDSVRDGNNSFTFGSNLGSSFRESPLSKVPDETKKSNIHDPKKFSTTNNLFVFGSDKKTDEIDKEPSVEKKGKSDTVTKVYSCSNTETSSSSNGGVPNRELNSFGNIRNQNQPINQNEKSSDGGQYLKTEAELKNTIPSSYSSSTIGLGFVSKEANIAGITNNFSFLREVGGFGTSFTGFNTPEINFASSFTSDMFPGLGKKLEFNKSNSVGQRKLKKNKAKLRQQGGRTVLSKEVPQSFEESSGCSPMDVSPYDGTEYVSTSTNPATVQVKNEDGADTTEKLSAKSFSSSSATSFADADVSARRRPHQKKYKMKTGHGSEFKTPKNRVHVSCAHEATSREHIGVSDQEICDKWRKRGNQAYKNGNLSEAEGCYSKGISTIQHTETPEFCIEPLLLCYSNRAAARMALGRLREGLKDCRMAAALDPNFVKANLRSANCHLLLGELDDASSNYNKCLESENIVCLDRRIAIDAADGLQKAQKVAGYLKLSAEFLLQKTCESATKALGIVADALSISCYSDKLLNMKGEALLMLGKHKEVVQLCEQTLDSAEKNFATEGIATYVNADGYDCKNSLKLWRWNLMSMSYFHLGRLELALELIEKHGQLRPTADKILSSEDSLIPLAVTIRELLHCKNAGNVAFQSGKHTEAVEHYTAAISKNIKSHAFAAVCFSNRAAAHQSLGEIIDAIGDCSIAIALDGSYPKALSRRSTLWEMIRDYKHAADDLQRLISILEIQSQENSPKSDTPGKTVNGSVKDLRRARRRLSFIEEKAKTERGIKPSDAAADVKKAYRKAALRHHPDKAGHVLARAESGNDGQQWKVITESIQMDADRLFKMIGEAYAVLSDSTKRSKYDLEEEMWDDKAVNVSSSSRRASNFYSSPFETPNRRNSQESRKTYSNSHYYPWEDSRRAHHSSYPRW